MAQIIDQIVNISIQDAISGVTTTDVNTMALVGKAGSGKDSAVAGEFASSDDIGKAYGTDSELYAMGVKFFAQDSQPSKVVCIPSTNFAGALEAVKAASEKFAFYHICADADSPTLEQLKAFQDELADAKKVLHLQIPATEGHATEKALMKGLSEYGANRIAVYLHDSVFSAGDGTNPASGEYLNVAIVANRCAADSARGTFAHKKCKSVTADSYGNSEYAELVGAGLNIYLTVSGEARLFMGTTCDASHFIDQVVKDDWIRFNVQSRIFALLGEANDGHGVNYDDAGIASVAASVSNVLSTAADTDHQYIMDGFSVDFRNYDYLKENYADDVRKRNLPLISGEYSRMNSIHTADRVTITVTL